MFSTKHYFENTIKTVVDADLELRRGWGWGGLDLLALLAFSLQSFLLFLSKLKGWGGGGGAGPRAPPLDSPLKNDRSPRDVTGQSYPIYACTRDNHARAL